MKYSTALCGKKLFSSPYSCAASVLLCERTRAGRPNCLMTFAIIIVLPEPVTPRSVWKRSPRPSPAVSSAMARGWSPAGWNGAWRSKTVSAMVPNITPRAGVCSGRGRGLLLGDDALPARDLGDPLHAPGGLHDLLQVGEVLHLHEHRPARPPVHRPELHAADVRPRGAHRRRDVRVEAAAVVALQRQAHDEALPLHLLPVDVVVSLRLVR